MPSRNGAMPERPEEVEPEAAEKSEDDGKQKAEAQKTVAPDPAVSTQAGPPSGDKVKVSPVAARMMLDNDLSVEDIIGGLKRITKKEVQMVIAAPAAGIVKDRSTAVSREENRQRMSSLRRKLAERLVAVKNETAMLTTFNECDMSEVIGLRKRYQNAFVEKHGVKLGFMSFFINCLIR